MQFAISEAVPGDYRIVLSVNGMDYESVVTILKDEWWADRR